MAESQTVLCLVAEIFDHLDEIARLQKLIEPCWAKLSNREKHALARTEILLERDMLEIGHHFIELKAICNSLKSRLIEIRQISPHN